MSRNALKRQTMLTELLEGESQRKKLKPNRTAPASTLLLEAQRAIEHKNFGGAVAILADTIGNIGDRKGDLIHVYDLRSHAYIKQKKNDLALKDAKQMITIDRADYRGYLRCAEIEFVSQKFEKAKKVCVAGLRTINADSRGKHRLQACLLRAEESLKTKVIYEKSTDPMLVLPAEILDIILAYFDYREVVAILRVSKKWLQRLKTADILTHNVDTSQTCKTLGLPQMKAAFSRLGTASTSISLYKLNENAAAFVNSEFKKWFRWEKLRSLTIADGKISIHNLPFDKLDNLQRLHLWGVDIQRDLNWLWKQCPRLEYLYLKCEWASFLIDSEAVYHRLNELVLEAPLHDQAFKFELPSNKCVFPNLARLELKQIYIATGLDLSAYGKLKILSLRNVSISHAYNLRTPRSLEEFNLVGEFPNIYPQPEEIKFPAGNLVSVSAQGNQAIRFLGYAIRQGLDRDKIRKLCLRDYVANSSVGNRSVENNLSTLSSIPGSDVFENVDALEISDNNLKDDDAITVSNLFPHIQSLEVESDRISEAFISEMIRRDGCKLKLVTLRNCSAVSQSVAAWAQSRGVVVEFRRTRSSTSDRGAKAIRYGG